MWNAAAAAHHSGKTQTTGDKPAPAAGGGRKMNGDKQIKNYAKKVKNQLNYNSILDVSIFEIEKIKYKMSFKFKSNLHFYFIIFHVQNVQVNIFVFA